MSGLSTLVDGLELPSNPSFSLGLSGESTANSLSGDTSASGTSLTSTAPIATPSPESTPNPNGRRIFSRDTSDLETPGRPRAIRYNTKGASEDETGAMTPLAGSPLKNGVTFLEENTPIATRKGRTQTVVARTKTTGVLSLREQEKLVQEKDKEIFDLKMKLYHTEEKLAQKVPEDINITLKQNVTVKSRNQTLQLEIKELKKAMKNLDRQNQELTVDRDKLIEELNLQNDAHEEEIAELREALKTHQQPSSKEGPPRADLEKLNHHLQSDLDELRSLLQDNDSELRRLREELERSRVNNRSSSSTSRDHQSRLEKRIADYERESTELLAKLEEYALILEEKEHLIGDLDDKVASLEISNERLELECQRLAQERSESRAEVYEQRLRHEDMEDGQNALRDDLAATSIALEQKETELETKHEELLSYVEALEQRSQEVEDWKAEVSEERSRADELQNVLAERESTVKELELRVSELETIQSDLHEKFEAALAHLDRESQEKDAELQRLELLLDERQTDIESGNAEIDHLNRRVFDLEEELDRVVEQSRRDLEDALNRAQLGEEISASLKEKLAQSKAELNHLNELQERHEETIRNLRSSEEELLGRAEDSLRSLESERQVRSKSERDLRDFGDKLLEADDEIKALRRELGEVERNASHELDEKEEALAQARSTLKSVRTLLEQRESDLAAVQTALRDLESEKRKLGESHTTDRFSLELELDRLKRDLARCEDELARARDDLREKERARRDRDGAIDKLHAEIRGLSSELASQTQARLNLSEKLDVVQAAAKQAEHDLIGAKSRVAELEQKLNKDQRSIIATESQFRDQLTERNTLLLTIYQYMDKILGVDKTPKKGTAAETKPFTNFAIFHDNMVSRLKSLSQIQTDFQKRAKEVETRITEKTTELKKQLDHRWKKIDRFEARVQGLSDAKQGWRRKYHVKEGELESLKSQNTELAHQISALKRTPKGATDTDIRAANSRAAEADRRAAAAESRRNQDQDRISGLLERESKWEARVREYERMLKEARETLKREKQGGKENVAQHERQMAALREQIAKMEKRFSMVKDMRDMMDDIARPGKGKD